MGLKPCIVCGEVGPGSYCRKHDPARTRPRNPARGSGWQASRWRARVLEQSGGRCVVCGSTDGVEAHHERALADGGEAGGEGIALCKQHHERATRAERRARKRTT